MSDVVVRAENLGKKYQLHHQQERQRYVALRDVFTDKLLSPWRKLGKKNPNSAIRNPQSKEDFWALKDVSFEIKQGEVVGIIGRNGAGKSTLLKILSRITEPTNGRVRIRGRVASLLEVGTGFHPELTGRENIYLNGAILGMRREEIKRKFDEIVAFAEIEKFLDTPVKRYSSGMYVRLAFAVAAHLESEILVVDEVLAVGDAEFQKKCLGKMSEVADGGRTVLFVSHNMAAVKSLTQRGVVLQGGVVQFDGKSDAAIHHYVSQSVPESADGQIKGGGVHATIRAVSLLDEAGKATHHYTPGSALRVRVVFETDGTPNLSLDIFLLDSAQTRVAVASTSQFHGATLPLAAGSYSCLLELAPLWLASGPYSFDVATSIINVNWDHYAEAAVAFTVNYCNPLGQPLDFKQSYGFGNLVMLATNPVAFCEWTAPAASDKSDRRMGAASL